MRSGGERSTLVIAAAVAAGGIVVGLLMQFMLSGRGLPPFVPPLTLPITLVLLAGVQIVFALRLRRAMAKGTGAVNPFQAVRLLVTARAGQLVGGFFGGLAGGLMLSLMGRSVPAPVSTWLPMAISAAAGIVLVACAAYAEHCCRVPPPEDPEEAEAEPLAG